jgi:hypothetical protein
MPRSWRCSAGCVRGRGIRSGGTPRRARRARRWCAPRPEHRAAAGLPATLHRHCRQHPPATPSAPSPPIPAGPTASSTASSPTPAPPYAGRGNPQARNTQPSPASPSPPSSSPPSVHDNPAVGERMSHRRLIANDLHRHINAGCSLTTFLITALVAVLVGARHRAMGRSSGPPRRSHRHRSPQSHRGATPRPRSRTAPPGLPRPANRSGQPDPVLRTRRKCRRRPRPRRAHPGPPPRWPTFRRAPMAELSKSVDTSPARTSTSAWDIVRVAPNPRLCKSQPR